MPALKKRKLNPSTMPALKKRKLNPVARVLNFLLILPAELVEAILLFLLPPDKINWMLTCKACHAFAMSCPKLRQFTVNVRPNGNQLTMVSLKLVHPPSQGPVRRLIAVDSLFAQKEYYSYMVAIVITGSASNHSLKPFLSTIEPEPNMKLYLVGKDAYLTPRGTNLLLEKFKSFAGICIGTDVPLTTFLCSISFRTGEYEFRGVHGHRIVSYELAHWFIAMLKEKDFYGTTVFLNGADFPKERWEDLFKLGMRAPLITICTTSPPFAGKPDAVDAIVDIAARCAEKGMRAFEIMTTPDPNGSYVVFEVGFQWVGKTERVVNPNRAHPTTV